MPGRVKRDHRLIKDGFIVELSGTFGCFFFVFFFFVSVLRTAFTHSMATFFLVNVRNRDFAFCFRRSS